MKPHNEGRHKAKNEDGDAELYGISNDRIDVLLSRYPQITWGQYMAK